jgi:hypothetical protein
MIVVWLASLLFQFHRLVWGSWMFWATRVKANWCKDVLARPDIPAQVRKILAAS